MGTPVSVTLASLTFVTRNSFGVSPVASSSSQSSSTTARPSRMAVGSSILFADGKPTIGSSSGWSSQSSPPT